MEAFGGLAAELAVGPWWSLSGPEAGPRWPEQGEPGMCCAAGTCATTSKWSCWPASVSSEVALPELAGVRRVFVPSAI